MNSNEEQKTALTSEEEGRDRIQLFIEDNLRDEQVVEPYKGYMHYSELADRWLPRLWVVAVIIYGVVWQVESTLSGSESGAYTGPLGIIIAVSFFAVLLFGIGAGLARRRSKITAEEVAYHELASAFQLYRKNSDNVEPVITRLSNSVKYIDPGRLTRLDSKQGKAVKRYLEKIDDAEKSEYISEHLHETFPQFMTELSTTVTPMSETRFSMLAKDMDSAYTGETAVKDRLKTDAQRIAHFVFTGPELIVTLSSLILLASTEYTNVGIGTAVGIFGGIIGVYSLYQNRD